MKVEEIENKRLLEGLAIQSFSVVTARSVTKLFLLEVDPKQFSVSVSKAQEIRDKEVLLESLKKHHQHEWYPPDAELLKELPLEPVSSQLTRKPDALVAFNGGFFIDYGAIFESNNKIGSEDTIFYGDPVGWYRTGGIDISFPYLTRPALMISSLGSVKIETCSLLGKQLYFPRGGKKLKLVAKNSFSEMGNAYYTSDNVLTMQSSKYLQYLSIVNNKLIEVNSSPSKVNCPSNGFIVGCTNVVDGVQVGDQVGLIEEQEYKEVVSGGPTLLVNGKPTADTIWEQEDFLSSNGHPKTLTKSLYSYTCARTGVFILENGNLLFSVCSGRTENLELCGLTLADFTEATINACKITKKLPVSGMYLDGGACTTFCYKEETSIKHAVYPSGTSNPLKKGRKPGHEAEIGSAIIISKKSI